MKTKLTDHVSPNASGNWQTKWSEVNGYGRGLACKINDLEWPNLFIRRPIRTIPRDVSLTWTTNCQ
jgi:hypothetical protein